MAVGVVPPSVATLGLEIIIRLSSGSVYPLTQDLVDMFMRKFGCC